VTIRTALVVWLSLGAAALWTACGARTDLDTRPKQPAGGSGGTGASSSTGTGAGGSGGEGAAGPMSSSSTGPACTSDAECADKVACTVDHCDPAVGCIHQPSNMLCDDGLLCTVDTCQAGQGCSHVVSDAPCDDGLACTIDSCDSVTQTCTHEACDNQCDDKVFCNGIERCDTSKGCVAGPKSCDLGIDCSIDSCNEGSKKCSHMSLCASGPHLLITDVQGALWDVQPQTGAQKLIAASKNVVHFDIALLGNRWFALNSGQFVELAPMTNNVIATHPSPGGNSLAAGPDGKLYAASSNVYRLDPNTGAATFVGPLPTGFTSSGDIAFLNGDMYVSTDGPCGGALVQFDLAKGSGKVLGGDGLGCVYGLAVSAGTLYIINCDGELGTFDPKTGVARVLSTSTVKAYGADTLP
jgi:hypothetical protein